MNATRTLLIVSYYFAPSAAVGAKRFSFLAREFERLGYRVHVIAAVNDSDQHSGGIPDPSLPCAQAVHRCPSTLHLPMAGKGWLPKTVNTVSRRLLRPVGREIFWTGPATREALSIARGAETGVVIATAPPWTSCIAGMRISRRLGWPLILDYRDPWTAYPVLRENRGKISTAAARWLEGRSVAQSSARVLNTPEMREWFERYFPHAPGEKNFVIPNGVEAVHYSAGSTAGRSLDIVHAGAIYTRRSLVPVVRALSRLVKQRPEYSGARVVTYGTVPEIERKRIDDEGLSGFFEVRPRISRDRLIQALQEARVLLVISGDDMGYSIPYKTYDYLAAGRPILALTGRGTALERFAAEHDCGAHADPANPDSVYCALERLLDLPNKPPSPQALQKHLWSNLASRYSDVIDSVLNDALTPRRNGAVKAA